MNRAFLSTAFMVAFAAAGAVLAPPASAAGGPLAGTWVSVDTDGSSQTLDITGSGVRAYAVTYFDESATSACEGGPARVSGPGFVDGDGIVLVGPGVCLDGGGVFAKRIAIGYHYDAGTDTLTDDFGIEWQRAN